MGSPQSLRCLSTDALIEPCVHRSDPMRDTRPSPCLTPMAIRFRPGRGHQTDSVQSRPALILVASRCDATYPSARAPDQPLRFRAPVFGLDKTASREIRLKNQMPSMVQSVYLRMTLANVYGENQKL